MKKNFSWKDQRKKANGNYWTMKSKTIIQEFKLQRQ